MKDPQSGLEIAPINHLPAVLQDALRHNLGDEQIPFVYLAQVLKKVSKGRKDRLGKDRLLLATVDTLYVYSADGSVKRKVRISDIAAVYFETAASPLSADANFAEYRTVVIAVPSSFDMAFETNRNPVVVINNIVRVLSVLRRLNSRDKAAGSELLVRAITPTVECGPLSERFELKKQKKGVREPILPPALPPVGADVIQRQSTDHQLQLEEVISHLLAELHKYKTECRDARATVYGRVCDIRAKEIEEVARYECEIAWTEARSAALKKANAARESVANAALERAQHQHAEQLDAIIKLRTNHTAEVEACQKRIAESEARVAKTKEAMVASHKESLLIERKVENDISEAQNQLTALIVELEACALLPTRADLEREAQGLHAACEAIDRALDDLRLQRNEESALRCLEQQLQDENAALKAQTMSAKEAAKEAATEARRATVELSALNARRERLEKVVETLAAEAQRLAEEEAAATQKADDLLAEKNALERRRQTLELERVVVEDLDRETLIHDSITSSIIQLMYKAEAEAMDVQGKLADDHGRLLRLASQSRSDRTSASPVPIPASPLHQ